jgi:hypothetical protein
MQSKTKLITGGALAVAVIGGGTGLAVAASSGDGPNDDEGGNEDEGENDDE